MAVQHNPQKPTGLTMQFLNVSKTGLEWIVAGFLTLLWLSALLTYGAGYFGWFDAVNTRTTTLLEVLMFVCALVLPIILCWIAAFFVAQTLRIRDDAQQLRLAVDDLALALKTQGVAGRQEILAAVAQGADEAVKAEGKRLDAQMGTVTKAQQEIAEGLKGLMTQSGVEKQELTKLVETAQHVAEQATQKVEAADQGAKSRAAAAPLALVVNHAQDELLPLEAEETPAPAALDWADLNRALNFPVDETDQEGFSAIRRVLPHRNTAQLLQSAEDVLSVMAQEGIFMDDLGTPPSDPDLWRRFAQGERGTAICDIGTVDDQAAIALVRGRMRTDEQFKAKTLEFLRAFDRVLTELGPQATDRELTDLAGTRSGLAFLLLARVNGAFG